MKKKTTTTQRNDDEDYNEQDYDDNDDSTTANKDVQKLPPSCWSTAIDLFLQTVNFKRNTLFGPKTIFNNDSIYDPFSHVII